MLKKPIHALAALVLALSACAAPEAPNIHPSILPEAPPRQGGEAASPPPRELTMEELLSFRNVRQTGPGGRFWGYRVLGTWQGHRFVAHYICSDLCPQYTVTVHHFIDLRTPEACAAIGAQMRRTLVPHGIGNATLPFCMPTPRMIKKAG